MTNTKNYTIDSLNPKEFIIIKGARVNNLKNLSVAIPRNKLVVITGLSGSGKSSLAFDTLFAEGQRMYVESLNSYARQFLNRMEKPEVEYIKGVSPAIAIEQKVNTRNPRSTVGTSTEIYDYMKLLFARVGKTISPVSGKEVKKDTITDVVEYIFSFEENDRAIISCPLKPTGGNSIETELKLLLQKGFTRILVDNEVKFLEEIILEVPSLKSDKIEILIDRASINKEDDNSRYRISDSVQTAFYEGEGICYINILDKEKREFSDKFELDGIKFEEPSANLFSFNNPYGACKTCEGYGKVLGIDEDLVIPDKSMSVFDGAIAPWRSESFAVWLEPLIKNGIRFDFPIHRAYHDLKEEERKLLWTGNKYFEGLNAFFDDIATKLYKIQYRVLLSRYRGKTTCPDCRGTRLRKDAAYVKVDGKSISDLVLMPIEDLSAFVSTVHLGPHEKKVADRILIEIKNRLIYLEKVGLGYLTLNRLTSTLSGGEFQRIKLATSLGSALVGSMYILDEPSIGLHPRDTNRLIEVLNSLKNMGNTVIVVEHEEEVMRSADQIIDIGPEAGSHGGELVFQGTLEELIKDSTSFTATYLNNKDSIPIPKKRRNGRDFLEISGARENNLKNVDVKIPLGILTVVTGVSGSGKSTLIKKILVPALSKTLGITSEATGKLDKLGGSIKKVTQLEFVDQNPIGKSSRSNPVTYIKAYDAIRQLYSDQALSKQRGYKPSHFSFNVDGGRCEMCQGEGVTKIEMQFMADIYLKCESCHGKRFKDEILEIMIDGNSISDVLDMTVEDSLLFFKGQQSVISKLKPLQEVGLGYIRLGQSSNTLSGGEAQRVKLASFLGKGNYNTKDHILFIFDEPTTGLHFHDINKLLKALNALVEQGNSVLIIEHNLDIIKCADWIIDLGPDGGDKGGQLMFEGTPETMIKLENNHTAYYLKEKFER